MQRIPIQMGEAGPIFFGHRAKIWHFYFPQKPQIPQPFFANLYVANRTWVDAALIKEYQVK